MCDILSNLLNGGSLLGGLGLGGAAPNGGGQSKSSPLEAIFSDLFGGTSSPTQQLTGAPGGSAQTSGGNGNFADGFDQFIKFIEQLFQTIGGFFSGGNGNAPAGNGAAPTGPAATPPAGPTAAPVTPPTAGPAAPPAGTAAPNGPPALTPDQIAAGKKEITDKLTWYAMSHLIFSADGLVQAFNKNGDAGLDMQELTTLLTAAGVGDKSGYPVSVYAQSMMDGADSNHDGRLTGAEMDAAK